MRSSTPSRRPVLATIAQSWRDAAELQTGDVLVVWKLDRLGRSLPHLLSTVNGLADRGISFQCLTQPVSTTDATGKLVSRSWVRSVSSSAS